MLVVSGFEIGRLSVTSFILIWIMDEQDLISLKKGNSSAQIHLFGATLVSWKVDGVEHLFVSGNSFFDNKKAIRGGVPFVFPQFGPWSNGPQHGFARISRWSVADEKQIGCSSVTLILEDNEKTREMWNNRFRIEYTITLEDTKISMNVKVTNTGDAQLSFNLLLHTYLLVPDVKSCGITGLNGCTYIDKAKNGLSFVEDRDEVNVCGFTDRVYLNTDKEHVITNVAHRRTISIEKQNFPETVVWNPWTENAKRMADFCDEEWLFMLCVEAGYVNKPCILEASESFHASQTLSVVEL